MKIIFKYFWLAPLLGLLLHGVVIVTAAVVAPGRDIGLRVLMYLMTLGLSVGSGVLTPLFWYEKPEPTREMKRRVGFVVALAVLLPLAFCGVLWWIVPRSH